MSGPELDSPGPPSLEDRIRGVVFGHAVGDALGLSTEGLTEDEVKATYPDGIDSWRDMIEDAHTRRWRPGDWTDDTEQMLCILDSLLEKGCLDYRDIALRLYRWVVTGGKGVGATVHAVATQPDYLRDPEGAARRIWEKTGKVAAANGGIMRTSILGIWDWQDETAVRRNAETACRLTHYDPRCVGSCVGYCLAVRALLAGNACRPAAEAALTEAAEYDERILEIGAPVLGGDIAGLKLGAADTMGYTLKTFGAALWALRSGLSYEKAIMQIVMAGGDADTNAAAAGALLGARDGIAGIPERWWKKLNDRRELDARLIRLIPAICGQDPQFLPET